MFITINTVNPKKALLNNLQFYFLFKHILIEFNYKVKKIIFDFIKKIKFYKKYIKLILNPCPVHALGVYGQWRMLNFRLNDIKRARSEAFDI